MKYFSCLTKTGHFNNWVAIIENLQVFKFCAKFKGRRTENVFIIFQKRSCLTTLVFSIFVKMNKYDGVLV